LVQLKGARCLIKSTVSSVNERTFGGLDNEFMTYLEMS